MSSDLEQLISVDFSQRGITNLSGLEYATNLFELYLSENSISDIGALAGMRSLAFLDLSHNRIIDLSPLAQLTNLWEVYLTQNSIESLTPIVGLKQLGWLSVFDNEIQDISPVLQLPSLTGLTFGENPVTNCTIVSLLTNLETLDISGKKFLIGNLDFIAGLTNLSSLYATSSALTNINVLPALPRLTDVLLEYNLLDLSEGSKAMNVITTLQARAFSRIEYLPQWQAANVDIRSNWEIPVNESSFIPFSIIDQSSGWFEMTVELHSSNQAILPDSGLSASPWLLGWILLATPSSNTTGAVTITLTATDRVGLSTNVTVLAHVDSQRRIYSAALSSNLIWMTAESNGFSNQVSESHDGIFAVQSGDDESWLSATVVGPGTLAFWWKGVSTNLFATEFLAGDGDNTFCARHLVANGSWQFHQVGLPSGTFHLKWSRFPDTHAATYWLDEVSFTPGVPVLSLTMNGITQNGVWMFLNGELGKICDVEISSDFKNWTALRRIIFYDSFLSIIDPVPAADARYYRLHQID